MRLSKALQPRPVELWLRELPLSPKSKTHVRSLMHGLVEFAMWAGLLDISRNPISLVQNNGATRKVRKARSLTAEQFQALLKELHEPFATMALFACAWAFASVRPLHSGGLTWIGWVRGSASGAASWSRLWRCEDGRLRKDLQSRRRVVGAAEVLETAVANFREPMIGFSQAQSNSADFPIPTRACGGNLCGLSEAAKIGHLGTHAFRHTYRSWLDAVGTPVAVQQKMMRHADIRTTFNIYGDVVTDEMTTASRKSLSLRSRETERKQSAKEAKLLKEWLLR